MKTILVTAYAINPFKGSEDGTGWNWVLQIARFQRVIAITRKNNQQHIEKYMLLNNNELYTKIDFHYYDLPKWASFWKKGSRGALLYFYLWQLCIVFWIKRKSFIFDIAHNLNFHNNWLPTFLWALGKPTVWGPVGHHDSIPKPFIQPIYGTREYLFDLLKSFTKLLMRSIDPFFHLAIIKCKTILSINSSGKKVLGNLDKIKLVSAIGSERPKEFNGTSNFALFNVLSVGRFVPLKGFDITIKAFAKFYHTLPSAVQDTVLLTLVGKGPKLEILQTLAKDLGIAHRVKWISWVEKNEMARLYQQSSIFLFPSHEGAGMVIPEALSYALPVICLDNPGPGELIDESCGIKIKITTYDQTVNETARALNTLFVDTTKRSTMSEMALSRFDNVFDWDRKGEFIQEIYQKI